MSIFSQKDLPIGFSPSQLLSWKEKIWLAIGMIGLLILLASWAGMFLMSLSSTLVVSLLLISIGTIGYCYSHYKEHPPGIRNDGVWFRSLTNRGVLAWLAALLVTFFYIALYFKAEWLGLGAEKNTGIISVFDPLSMLIHGTKASQWFMYGTLYTVAILIFGIKFLWKYRHNRYQVIRTLSVICAQLFLAYLIPEILSGLNGGFEGKWFDMDLKNQWPLDYDFAHQWHIDNMFSAGTWGWFFFAWSLFLVFVLSPWLTYKYGKRWYCSWVCGCGGLAETAGDPWRHLSDKSLKAWKVERWVIHLVLLFSFVMTMAVIYSFLGYEPDKYWLTRGSFTLILICAMLLLAGAYYWLQTRNAEKHKNRKYIIAVTIALVGIVVGINWIAGSSNAYFIHSESLKQWYGFYIGAVFSGVIGVGFYPLMGSRVWCRFGCPMAAILGLQQKLFSKFRITTNGGQCISCGNCSTYCEMGIDVRAYAQRGQDIVRASCVGCGVCSAVCPRGVLRLENASSDIYEKAQTIRNIQIIPTGENIEV